MRRACRSWAVAKRNRRPGRRVGLLPHRLLVGAVAAVLVGPVVLAAGATRCSRCAMSYEVVPLELWHLEAIIPQAMQAAEVDAQALAAPVGNAWAALLDGKPIAAAGLIEVWAGRAYAWALFADGAARQRWVIRAIRSALDSAAFRRIELAVDASFFAGCRFADALGFKVWGDGPQRQYLPNGRDAWVYVRVKA